MTRTAAQEHFGDAVDKTLSADYSLRLPSGVPGAARFYVLRPTGSTRNVTIPSALMLRVGGPLYTIANRSATESLAIKDNAGTTLTLLDPDEAVQLWLLDNATAAGTWVYRVRAGVVESDPTSNEVEQFDVVLGSMIDFNLRTYVEDVFGYDGVAPAVLRVTIAADAIIGSTDTTGAASFYSGSWPADSLLFLTLEEGSYIVGKGGHGGRGGDVPPGLLSQSGGAGGHALDLNVDTILVNYGKIQGGGGGGGGGVYQGTVPGPGGGGGAGFQPSKAGAGGGSSNSLLLTGGPGNLEIGGPGGGVLGGGLSGFGGSGGGPGEDGGDPSISGGVGGDAGAAIRVDGSVTLTKVVAGTIDGAEIVV